MNRQPKATRYVTQDGADFYIYRDAGLTSLQTIWSWPCHVGLSLDLAMEARKACIAQLEHAGYNIEWPNPFGEDS